MTRRRWLAALALVLLCAMFLSRIGGFVLQDPDEGRYAEIPREMLETGDWVTPKLFYVKYFEKPPLLYWLTALSFRAFGLTEGAARLVPALSGIVTVLLTFALGVRLCGRRAAWIGAGVLATMPLFFALSQAVMIDMLLTACITAALGGVYAAHLAEDKRRWALAVVLATALGMLAKGPIAVVLPGGIALGFLAAKRDWATARALLHWHGILLFVVIVAPWFVLVQARNPEFFDFFIVREHFERFLASAPGKVGHPEGAFFYVPVLLFGPAPWTLVAAALGATARGRAAFAAIPHDARRLLLLWSGLMVAFFTVSTSKLASYVLPALPALALLLGAWLDRALADETLSRTAVRTLRTTLLALGVVFALTALLAWPLLERIAGWVGYDASLVVIVAAAASLVALATLATAGASRALRWEDRGRPAAALALLTCGLALTLVAAIGGRAVVKTSRAIADAMAPLREPGDLLISYKRLMQGLGFYTRQRIVQFGAYHEIAFGAKIAPDHDEFFWEEDERLQRAWASGRRVFVATDAKHIPHLVEHLDPAPRLLVQDQRRVVLVNFPAAGSEALVEADASRPAGTVAPGG